MPYNQQQQVHTRTSWPIQAKDMRRYTAQRTAKATQNGETASVRYETVPKKGTLMKVSPACLNQLDQSYDS